MTETAKSQEEAENPMRKFEPSTLKAMELRPVDANQMTLAPSNMAEAMEFAKLMAASTFVPQHLRGKAGNCLAVVIQALDWKMSPFAVASKTYFVNDMPAYEAQLIHAVVNSRAPLAKRLRPSWSGEGPTRRCKIVGWLVGETEALEYETPMISQIKVQNSPLWKSDPDQQLCYYATRSWARRYVPEVTMGIYARDEVEHLGAENAKDVTPPRPKYPEPPLMGTAAPAFGGPPTPPDAEKMAEQATVPIASEAT